jgi:hypothetical protein
MAAQPLFPFGTVTYPAPNGGLVRLHAALLQKLFDIPQ